MSGHTPGRWEAAERGDYDDFDGNSRVIIGDADNTHGHMMRIAVVQHSGDAESEANTRVIEAAPKLLEACRAMVAWDESETKGPDYGSLTRDTHPQGELIWRRWWDDQHALCRHAFDTARAAIAEAEDKP